jgi:hypothetical protein
MTLRLVLSAAILWGGATQAQAQQVLDLQIANGRVTLDAQGVSIRQILVAWTRVGGTLMVNGDQVSDAPVTVRFVDAPERAVLASLLRDVAGYVLAGGNAAPPGTATVGRIVILPTSSPVAGFSGPGFGSNLGVARQDPAPEPMFIEEPPPFPTQGVAQAGANSRGQGTRPASQAGAAFAQAAPQPAQSSQAPLFQAPVEEIPGPGFVPGMVDDGGRLVRGPTSESGAAEPAAEAPAGPPVQPNPFGVTSGSASPGTIAPGRPSQP